MKTWITAIVLSFGLVFAASAQVNVTTYGNGVVPRYTTITPIYGGYQATTYGGGLPTTYSTITGSPRMPSQQPSVIIPKNLVTPAAPLDFGGVLNSYQNSYQNALNADAQRQTTEYMRRQSQLLEQRSRMEAEQYRTSVEVRQQEREAALAEAKLRKAIAESKLSELQAKQAEEKERQDETEQFRRQEAQKRFARITAEVQKEIEQEKARRLTQASSTAKPPETK